MWRAISGAWVSTSFSIALRAAAATACVVGTVRLSGGKRAVAIAGCVFTTISLVTLIVEVVRARRNQESDPSQH